MLLLKVGVVIGPYKYEKVFDGMLLLDYVPRWLLRRTRLLTRGTP